ncbi:transposase [Lacticaseibacillus casei UW4]|nr:transposase [Lacticaseibacillus casei UW4]
MVKKHSAELANLLATYEPNGTAMDMTIATLKRHQIAVLAAVTSPYSNGPIKGLTASSSHSNDPVLASRIS